MQYRSTRNKDIFVSSSAAISKGLSPDGGLFVPQFIPQMSLAEIELLSDMDYRERAISILGRFLTDFSETEISQCVNAAYTDKKFDSADIAPLKKISDQKYILELWHGPTCAFKDMALQILPHLLAYSTKKQGIKEETVILVATSGDTGKAALSGFADVPGTKIVVFYPENGVSRIQKLQMTTQDGGNVYVSAVNGNFDDAQNGIKRIFTDGDYEKELKKAGKVLSSANSINWGRLVPQIVYYFSAYANLFHDGEIKIGENINIVVPTGNFGNILAAFYASRMGLPVNKFICASNSNNVLTDFIKTGIYDRNRKFNTTISPSMDILISSNLERFLFDITIGDEKKVSEFMQKLRTEGKYDIGENLRDEISNVLYGGYCNDDETMNTIRTVFEKYSYVADTHTAVALKVYDDYVTKTGDSTKTVIASTASPYKFSASVVEAICGDIVDKDEFQIIDMLTDISKLPVPSSLAELKNKKVRFNAVCEPDDMKATVCEFLGF